MNKTNAANAHRKDVALTRRYGKIGISAVAAAARYQGKGKKSSTARLRSEDSTDKSSKIMRGTSPRR